MDRFSLYAFLLASSLLSAQPLAQEQIVQKGNEISGKLLQTLGGELKTHMQNGGALNALHFCSQNALTLTDKVAKESDAKIKRVALLNRNPLNAPSSEEEKIILDWQSMAKMGKVLPTYELKKGVYYKPILINNEACLKCHGNLETDSPLAKAIKETYPEDKATGYKMGDLRGMIVIEFAH